MQSDIVALQKQEIVAENAVEHSGFGTPSEKAASVKQVKHTFALQIAGLRAIENAGGAAASHHR